MQSDFSVRVVYEVLSIHTNVLTDIVLCLKRQYLLNICKLMRQTRTIRYNVAIIIFGGNFSIRDHSFTTWRHKLTTKRFVRRFPKTVWCRWTNNEVQSWTFSLPMGHMKMLTQHVIHSSTYLQISITHIVQSVAI